MPESRSIVPTMCPSCYGVVVDRQCKACAVSWGAVPHKEKRHSAVFYPKFSRQEVSSLRQTYLKESVVPVYFFTLRVPVVIPIVLVD